ncbi:MAG: hypothetical protein Q9N02_07920, partial [Ghiorsea sp.]|nr:hypothetical protein [Ghiorsea sp.]
ARVQVLQKSSSRLATMYAVAPLFPSMVDADWFQGMHQRFTSLKETIGAGKVIAFTMPNPPDKYPIKVRKHTEQIESPPTFEQALSNILNRYLPR